MSLGHVYVVEDDESMRSTLFNFFIQQGYTVDTFAESQSFIEQQPLTRSPAVILLDVRLPGESGVDTQSVLKRLKCETPIVFMSGSAKSLEIVTAMREGAFDFLLKPFSIEQLSTVIKQALDRDAARQELTNRKLRLGRAFRALTPREKQICLEMLDGKTNKQIAEQSGTVASTIKLHRARVLDKMSAESLADLIEMFKGIDPNTLVSP